MKKLLFVLFLLLMSCTESKEVKYKVVILKVQEYNNAFSSGTITYFKTISNPTEYFDKYGIYGTVGDTLIAYYCTNTYSWKVI